MKKSMKKESVGGLVAYPTPLLLRTLSSDTLIVVSIALGKEHGIPTACKCIQEGEPGMFEKFLRFRFTF